MKNLKFKTVGMLILAVLLSVNINAFGQKGNGGGSGNGNRQGMANGQGTCSNIPNLTADQKTKIEGFRTTHLKGQQKNGNVLAEKRARLQTLRTADNVDLKAVNKTIDEMSVLRTNMAKSREKHLQDVRNLLTAEQKLYFDNSGRGKGKGNVRGSNGQGRGTGNGKGQGRGQGRCKR